MNTKLLDRFIDLLENELADRTSWGRNQILDHMKRCRVAVLTEALNATLDKYLVTGA